MGGSEMIETLSPTVTAKVERPTEALLEMLTKAIDLRAFCSTPAKAGAQYDRLA